MDNDITDLGKYGIQAIGFAKGSLVKKNPGGTLFLDMISYAAKKKFADFFRGLLIKQKSKLYLSSVLPREWRTQKAAMSTLGGRLKQKIEGVKSWQIISSEVGPLLEVRFSEGRDRGTGVFMGEGLGATESLGELKSQLLTYKEAVKRMVSDCVDGLGEDRYEKAMNMFLTRRITFKEFLDMDLQKIKELDEVTLEDVHGEERDIDRMSTGEWE